jgi:hypothetical protein
VKFRNLLAKSLEIKSTKKDQAESQLLNRVMLF